MKKNTKYYLVEAHILPEIVVKVMEAKTLLDEGKVKYVSEAVKAAGVSRSAYYKYYDSVRPFFEYEHHKTMTIALSLVDNPGVLGHILKILAEYDLNILAINQTIPINRIANVTITFETRESTVHINTLIETLKESKDVSDVNLLARE